MIVVVGATGNVGRPLVQALAAAGEQVTAVSRHLPGEHSRSRVVAEASTPDATQREHSRSRVVAEDAPRSIRHRQADLAVPETLRPVLDGADALFLLVAGDGLNPGDVLDVAEAGGVKRVVLLSSQGVRTRPDAASYAHLGAFEEVVRRSSLEWTVLRPGGFDSNAFLWAEPIRSQRAVAAPFPDVALPFIDPADIAEVAAVALRDGTHAGHTYELTGPAPVSPREQVRAIGEALGTQVRFVEQSRDEARAQLLRFMPEVAVDGTLDIMGEPTADERRVSPDVERVLGRAPRTFAGWAERNVAAFR